MRKFMLGVLTVALATVVGVMAGVGPAVANHQNGDATITCSAVSGSFSDFSPGDHPIVWHVKVGAGAYQTVATTDFVGSNGTASANIASLTSGLQGVSTVVSAYATWTGHTGPTTSATVTCGTAPTTTVAPTTTTVAPTTTTLPAVTTTRPPAPPVAPPAVIVLVPARFTG